VLEEDAANVETDHQDLLDARKGEKSQEAHLTFAEFWAQFKANFKSAWPILMSMWLIFTVTFVVYPAVFLKSGFGFMSSMADKDRSAWYLVLF